MMIDPPVDKLIDKSRSRFELVCAISKRAKEILALEEGSFYQSNLKAITYASKEFYDERIKVID